MKRIAVFASLMIIAAGTIACGGPGRMSPEKRATFMLNRMAGKLDLTEAQEKKAEAIKQELLDRFKQSEADRKLLHDKARTLALNDSIDRTAVLTIMDGHHAMMEKNKTFIADKIVEFHAMLTREQKQKLVEMMDRRMQK